MNETRTAESDGPQSAEVYARSATEVVSSVGSDASSGLTGEEAAARLTQHGANEITGEEAPSLGAVALQQLRDPMNLMLVAVTS